MRDKFVKANRPLNKFLRALFRFYLNRLFRLKFDITGIDGLTPPYAVLANHVNFWDPFILSLCISEPVYYVASDAYFRNPLLRWLLGLVGAIPKAKFITDPHAIRGILEVNHNSGIIGIFPEGRRSWDGKTLPLRFATVKLIKSLELPVVSILLEGACLALPRWAARPRKGEIKVSCRLLIAREELSGMPAEVIYDKITVALENDEYRYQEQHMNRYAGHNLAEKLELFLFACPHCHTIGMLESKGDSLYCNTCDYQVKYNVFGLFNVICEKPLCFNNPRDWNLWQLEYLETYIRETALSPDSHLIFKENDMLALTGERLKPLVKLQYGTLEFYTDRIAFSGKTGEPLVFNISSIHGENIQGNNKLEFYYGKVLYRFVRSEKCFSAYKWVKGLQIVKNM